MGFFNFFGDGEHKVFNYKPMYYDPKEDERKRKFGETEVPEEEKFAQAGSSIRGAFRNGAYKKTRTHLSKTQKIIGIITLILCFVVLYYIAKFYTLL